MECEPGHAYDPQLRGNIYPCDYFWRCNRGKAEPMECEPGHAYDPQLRGNIYPCDYVFNVNCTGRELLRE